MAELEERIVARIDAAIARCPQMVNDHALAHQLMAEAINICEGVYGSGSVQLTRLTQSLDHLKRSNTVIGYVVFDLSQVVAGTLHAIRDDVVGGRISVSVYRS